MRRQVIGILAAGLFLAPAACDRRTGGGVPTAGGTASATTAPAGPAAFTGCLREHGMDAADPQPGASWSAPRPRTAGEQQALDACREFLPADAGEIPTAKELEAMRSFAKCMRDHDIPMADPLPDEPGGGKLRIGGRFENAGKDRLLGDPQVKAAMETCVNLLPERFRPTE